MNFWVKSPATDATKAIEITTGTNSRFYVAFDNSTTLDFGGAGTVTVAAVDDGEWHNFWVIRKSTVISVYQNTTLKGTITTGSSTKFGGADFTLGFDSFDTQFFDVSLKNTLVTNIQVITVAALTDYYSDVINNEGRNYLP